MNERQHIQVTPNPTTWNQWGKAAFAFTVATGAYAISNAVRMVWSSQTNQTQQLDNKENKETLEHHHVEEFVLSASPLITISTLALTAPQYPWISFSVFGLSWLQQIQFTEAAFPATLDLGNLTDSDGFVFQGAVVGDHTGFSVSSAGDVNGDGLDDVLVGAYAARPFGRIAGGIAYLLFGINGSWPALVDLGNLTSSQGVLLQGAEEDIWMGQFVSSAGDVNGDNLSDVLVGAYGADSVAGVAYLLFGSNGSWPAAIDLASFNGSQGVVLQGAATSDYTGWSVSAAGDVNGDGLADMLVGAPGVSPLGRAGAGAAYLLFGANGSWPALVALGNLMPNQGVVLMGDGTGRSLSGAGDVNGDGLDDVLVGAYQASPLGRTEAGTVYLLFGRNGSWPATLDLANLTDTEGVVLQGAVAFDNTGYSVSHAGDVNGDGLDDVLVGVWQADPLGRNGAGVAYLLFGRNGSWPATIDLANLNSNQGVLLQGAAPRDWTGTSVSSAGDINGDGLADVLVGAWNARPLGRSFAGEAYLLFGRNGSWPAVVDLGSLTSSQGVVLQGAAAGDETGTSVSSAGDVNGDGLADVLVGAWKASPLGRSNAGAAYVVFGQGNNSLKPTQRSGSTIRALSQKSPGFSVYSNSVLYLKIDVETLITTDNLSVEGFTGDPSQLVFRLPESPNYEVTVNGVEQYQFSWSDVSADFVRIRLGEGVCFEDFNDIPVQVSDGSTTADFNLVFQMDTDSCGYNGVSSLNAKSALQSAAMLLLGSGFGIFASGQREKTNHKKTESNLLTNQNEGNLAMKLSA